MGQLPECCGGFLCGETQFYTDFSSPFACLSSLASEGTLLEVPGINTICIALFFIPASSFGYNNSDSSNTYIFI